MNKINHHYTECGLMNVVIRDMEVILDDEGDELITVPAVNELHRLISTSIVSHPKGMSGAELRFLRTEMGLTQNELSVLVHRDKQSIGRWERAEIELDSSAEALIRRLAIEKLNLDIELGIDELSKRSIPTAETQSISIRRVDDGNQHYELIAA